MKPPSKDGTSPPSMPKIDTSQRIQQTLAANDAPGTGPNLSDQVPRPGGPIPPQDSARFSPEKGDCVLLLAFDRPIEPPIGAADWKAVGFDHVIHIPDSSGTLSEDELRWNGDRDRFRNAWQRAVSAIDRGVKHAVSVCTHRLHIVATCPYPAGFYLGQRLQAVARYLPLVLYQWDRFKSGWTPFLLPEHRGSRAEEATFFEADTMEVPRGGPAYVVSIEVAQPAQRNTLLQLARDTGAGWIHRLTPVSWRTIEPGQEAAAVVLEVSNLLDEFQRRHPHQTVHLVTSAPLALAIAVGGMFNPNVYREVVVHDFAPQNEPPTYYPVLELIAPRVMEGLPSSTPPPNHSQEPTGLPEKEEDVPIESSGAGDRSPAGPGAPPDRPLYSNDGMPDIDSLGMSEQAEDFAKLIAAEDVKPPLAIGLFGEWGVGKSYFMRCIRSAVEQLIRSRTEDEGAPYVRRVAHIDFNAWHYSDTNLWAVMAIRIFEGLAETIRSSTAQAHSLAAELTSKIRSSSETLKEAEKRMEAAERQREKALEELACLEARRRSTVRTYGKVLLQMWRDQKRRAESGAEAPEHGADPLVELQHLAQKLGLNPVIETADDLLELADRVISTGSGIGSTWRTLSRPRTLFGTLVLFVFVAMAELSLWRLPPGWWDDVIRFFEFLVPAGSALGWALQRATRFRKLLETTVNARRELTSLRDRIEEGLQRETREDDEVRKILRQIARLDNRIAEEQQRVSQCAQEIDDAWKQRRHIESGGVVYDFLTERLASSTYRHHLGLLSTIRRDLEHLEETLREWHAVVERGKDGKDQAVPIDRIVLYIDDLDRCQPDQVVRVLQAVHLLLAFKLFVVVVAVDARWLQHSLQQTFRHGGAWSTVGERAVQHELAFSPQNYLEKIFQIPVALEAMSPAGYRRLIEDLNLQGQPVAAEVVPPPPAASSEERSAEVEQGEPEQERPAQPAAEEAPEMEASTTPSPSFKAPPENGGDADAPTEQALLTLGAHEVAFIQTLQPFVRTPRVAKRMLNIYRLIRVSVGRIPDRFHRFIDPDSGDYLVVLTLLGLVTRFPDTGCRLLHRMASAPEPDEKEEFLPFVVRHSKEIAERGGRTPTEQEDLFLLISILESMWDHIPHSLRRYQPWARMVGRHSFNWNILPDDRRVERGVLTAKTVRP